MSGTSHNEPLPAVALVTSIITVCLKIGHLLGRRSSYLFSASSPTSYCWRELSFCSSVQHAVTARYSVWWGWSFSFFCKQPQISIRYDEKCLLQAALTVCTRYGDCNSLSCSSPSSQIYCGWWDFSSANGQKPKETIVSRLKNLCKN